MNSLTTLCDRAILLDQGQVLVDGDPNRVGKIYHELLFGADAGFPLINVHSELQATEPVSSEVVIEQADPIIAQADDEPKEHRYGDRRATISDVRILDLFGTPVTRLDSLKRYRISTSIIAQDCIEDFAIGLLIRTSRGVEVFGTDSLKVSCQGLPDKLLHGQCIDVHMDLDVNLAPRTYFVTVSIALQDGTKLDMRLDCQSFDVIGPEHLYHNSIANCPIAFECALR
jgi:hypothetical protein